MGSTRRAFLRRRVSASLFTLLVTTFIVVAQSRETTSQEVSMGTTLVAVKYDTGIVVAADSRTSVSGYVSNRFAHKITPISEHCVVLRSGSAADTQNLAQQVRAKTVEREHLLGVVPSISNIAHYLRYLVYDESYTASLLVAGYDKGTDAPALFSISPSGALIEEEKYAASGSGSSYILGFIDDQLNNCDKLTENEAIEISRRAVLLAIQRDGSSGGIVRMAIVNNEGTKSVEP